MTKNPGILAGQNVKMCISPIKVKNSGDQPVPCGRCSQCRARRVSAWSFRLMQEEKVSNSSQFITLTYGNSTVPITNKGYMSLRRRDIQLFIKRLRKAHSKIGSGSTRLKYYIAGEYGGETGRPHYHCILFNAERELLQSQWGLGQIHYGNVTGASIGYSLKYISKQSQIPKHKNDDRQKEFALMSKGIGKNYLDPERGFIQWHKNDMENRCYINIGDGKKASMPRYYKDKLYSEEERKKIAAIGIARAITDLDSRITRYGTDAVMGGLKINLEKEKSIIILPYKDNL